MRPTIQLHNIIVGFVLLISCNVYGQEIIGTKDISENSIRNSAFFSDASQYSFYAVYNNLLNTQSHNINCATSAMSADGNKLIFSCRDNTTEDLLLYTINTDGSNLTAIPLPEDITDIQQVVINKDGSLAFFHQGLQIYKVVGNTATKIYDYEDHSEPGGFYSIQITGGGEQIYLLEGSSYSTGSIWKMDNTGSGIVKVFEYKDVERDGGTGAGISKFAISEDASIIAFILRGYRDNENNFHYKYELFTKDESGFHQLTNDNENIIKDYMAISGDGSTIVFNSASPENKWYSIQSNGSNKIPLEDKYANISGPVLSYNGTKVFYSDDRTEGGRMVYTNGTKRIGLFPHTSPHFLIFYTALSVNSDGNMISFIHRTGFDYYALYVGYINPSSIISDVPKIENISFDPPLMPNDNPEARIILASQISDPQGLADITATATDVLLDGVREATGSNMIPVKFLYAANDSGAYPDQVAEDGIFCSEGRPGPTIDQYNSVVVRVGAMDVSGNTVVADTVLNIGENPVDVNESEKNPVEFKLYQNYPNPFNSITNIQYAISDPANGDKQFVALKVYNILGKEIATLVNEGKPAGYYEITFNASELPSGIYIYSITTGEYKAAKKLIILK